MALYGDGSNVNKTTDATAATYGSASAVPQITVDGNQRISSISNVSITLDASINANASVGDVGTYAFLQQANTNSAVNPGATAAGSTLRYSDATGRMSGNPAGPNGSWRCMGYDSGAALANTSNTGSASASASGNITGSLQGGQVQGNASLQGGQVQGNAAIQGGEVQGNSSFSGSGGLQGGNVQGNTNTNGNLANTFSTGNTKGNLGVTVNHLGVGGNVSVSGNVATNGLNVAGNVGTAGLDVSGNVGTDGLDVSGNVSGTASINVSVNSVSANVTVAYSSTLWLRYS